MRNLMRLVDQYLLHLYDDHIVGRKDAGLSYGRSRLVRSGIL